MKKTIFTLLIMMGLGFQMNIQAQTTCTDVIWPGGAAGVTVFPLGCPAARNIQLPPTYPPPDIGTCSGIQFSNETDYGDIALVELADANIIHNVNNLVTLGFYYYPTTNCSQTDSFTIIIPDGPDCEPIGYDTMNYILHLDYECETPDDVFCCILPGSSTNTLDVLANDATFIEDNYDYDTFTDTLILILPPTNGVFEGQQVNPFAYTPNQGFTGLDSFSYQVTDTIITPSGDMITVCDEQWCYIFVEDCLNTMPDGACLNMGDTVCIDPLANDIAEPTLYHPILDSIGCTSPDPLPMLDPTTLTQPVPIDGGDALTDDGMGGWCFIGTSPGTYTYTYEVRTDMGGSAIDTIRFGVFSECICDDYIALRALYLDTNGDCWTNNTGWPDLATFLANPYSPPAGFMGFDTWYGINVNPPTGCVANIYLPNNNLYGTLPSELGIFRNRLGTLRLEENRIYGNIPPELGNLTQLINLILDNNELSGRIPGALGNISTLTCLSLYNNQLSGCYDSNLSLLCSYLGGSCNNNTSISNGNNFDADWEDFCSPQREGICNCPDDDYAALRALYLSTNGDSWFSNTGWPDAILFNNPLYETTPPPGYSNLSTWYGVIVGTTNCVKSINMSNNNLAGTIPDDLDKLCKITSLNLSFNQLTGTMPAALGNMVNLTNLNLSDNQLTGSLTAEISYLRQLDTLDVTNNQLTGCFDIKLLDLCNQLTVALVDTGNNFDADWIYFCNFGAGACKLPGNCLNDIQLHVYLEGPYDTNSASMQTDLNTSLHVLPGQTPVSPLALPTPPGQPYNTAPWNYTGTEGLGWTDANYTATMVDWVMVSIRTTIDRNTEVDRVAALLHNDGSIDFLGYGLFLPTSNPIYIVVEHRNHLGIMTPSPVSLINGGLTYDFRAANSYDGGNGTGFGQKEIASGIWAMYAGDGNQFDAPSYDINGDDKILWTAQNGNFNVYTQADFNMDGDTNGADKALWSDNNGVSSRVER